MTGGRLAGLSIMMTSPSGFGYFIDYAGRGGDQIQVKLTLQAHLDDFHVQQAQEAAAEAVAQRHAGFGIIG